MAKRRQTRASKRPRHGHAGLDDTADVKYRNLKIELRRARHIPSRSTASISIARIAPGSCTSPLMYQDFATL